MKWFYITSRNGKLIGLVKAKGYEDAKKFCTSNHQGLVRAYHSSKLFQLYYYLTRGVFHVKPIRFADETRKEKKK